MRRKIVIYIYTHTCTQIYIQRQTYFLGNLITKDIISWILFILAEKASFFFFDRKGKLITRRDI